LASTYKRQFMIEDQGIDDIRRMRDHYAQAEEIARNSSGDILYPQLNKLTADAIVALRSNLDTGAAGLDHIDQAVDEIRRKLPAMDAQNPDFFLLAMHGDAMLVRLLASPKSADRGPILQAYEKAWRRGGTPLQMMSVFDQLAFVERSIATGGAARRQEREVAHRQVTALFRALKQSTGIAVP